MSSHHIHDATGAKCIVCGKYVLEHDAEAPKHYHQDCVPEASKLALIWHGKPLKYDDNVEMAWVRENEDEGTYLGVSFEDDKGVYGAVIAVFGVEGEGTGGTALEALDDAYADLKEECFRITGKAFALGQGK